MVQELFIRVFSAGLALSTTLVFLHSISEPFPYCHLQDWLCRGTTPSPDTEFPKAMGKSISNSSLLLWSTFGQAPLIGGIQYTVEFKKIARAT